MQTQVDITAVLCGTYSTGLNAKRNALLKQCIYKMYDSIKDRRINKILLSVKFHLYGY
jgi:hypothetical protein